MDSKRVILAIVLSLGVLVGWNYIGNYFFPAPPKPTQNATSAQTPGQAKKPTGAQATADLPEEAGTALRASDGKDITVTTPLFTAVFNTAGGTLKHFHLHKYKRTIAQDSPDFDLIGDAAAAKAPFGLLLRGIPTWKNATWSDSGEKLKDIRLDQDATGILVFKGEIEGIQIERELRFSADSYRIEEKVRLRNTGAQTAPLRLGFSLAATWLALDKDDKYNHTRAAYLDSSGLSEVTDSGDLAKGIVTEKALSWGAVQDNYFILALIPNGASTSAGVGEEGAPVFKAKFEGGVYRAVVEKTLPDLAPKATAETACEYYIGPKEHARLDAAPAKLSRAIDLGWFDFIAKPLIIALNWIYRYVQNYGLAIIILTIGVKIVLWPLSHKSYKSMEQMKKLQPMLSKLREKYKDDRQKMNEEMMQLYKTYKVNPAGGCLPMAMQIPVFFGLYNALLNSIELRHAPFLMHVPFTNIIWLADLSAKDPFYVTPLIMGATMFIQQKMTPAPGDPTQAKIMMFMPVIFTFMFLNFPSGLVVYWLVNNVLSIAQQRWMLRKA